CLKKQLQNAELHFLVRPENGELLVQNPYIDYLHLLHFNPKTTAETLKQVGFNHVINLSGENEASSIEEAIHAPQLPKSQKDAKTFFKHLFQHIKSEHPAAQYLKKAAALGIANDGAGLNYFIPPAAEVPFADIPAA